MFFKSFLTAVIAIVCISSSARRITKLDMKLSAFGVESDRFPNIDAIIDFEKGTSVCKVSYYHPDYKPFKYTLSKDEMNKILALLQKTDLGRLKENYTVSKTDQLTSTTVIYTEGKTYTIQDYGLESTEVLIQLYDLVYKWDKTVK